MTDKEIKPSEYPGDTRSIGEKINDLIDAALATLTAKLAEAEDERDAALAEVERLAEKNNLLHINLKDQSSEDTEVRNAARPYVDVDGDSYGVPTVGCIVEALVAIVSKLPKTADGVPVVPVYDEDEGVWEFHDLWLVKPHTGEPYLARDLWSAKHAYSTRTAALAQQEGQDDADRD